MSLFAPDRRCIVACISTFLLSLVVLSVAGSAVSARPLEAFTRFHRYLNADSLYYPTLSQVLALAHAAASDQQTLVIGGGNSLMYGAAQGTDEVWTTALQQELGPSFGVVNLALPAGAPGEHGSVTAQALLREGRELVHVTQVFPAHGEADGAFYRYVVWEARGRGLLLPSPEREALLSQPSAQGPAVDVMRSELRIRSAMEQVLHFSDLWQAIGYQVGVTMWQPFTPPGMTFWAPRRLTPDPAPPLLDLALRNLEAQDDVAMKVLWSDVESWCTQSGDSWRPVFNEAFWTGFSASLNAQVPAGLRERTVAQILPTNPYFTKRLPETARACLLNRNREVTARLRSAGFHAVLVGLDWTEDDYFDRIHPSGAGGKKMAAELAPVIRAVATGAAEP